MECLKNVLETKSDAKLVENFIPCVTNVFLVERKRLPSEPLDIIFEPCTCWNHICTYLLSYLYMLETYLYIAFAYLSSPRAESARAFTGRQNSHSGRGEDFLTGQPDFFTETAVTPERNVEKSFPMWEINRHAEG